MTNKERTLFATDKAPKHPTYDIYPYGFHIMKIVAIVERLGYDESMIVAPVVFYKQNPQNSF
jgi:hypothetical protein